MNPQQEYRGILAELRSEGMLPGAYRAIFAGGSIVRGWGNPGSDIDIYVVVTEPWQSETAERDMVSLAPGFVLVDSFYSDGRRFDVEYWLDSQIDELFAKVAPSQLLGSSVPGRNMTYAEISCLEKLAHAALIDKDEWVAIRQHQLAESSINAVMTLRSMHEMDIYTEDAVGQLAGGDVESALISAKIAFGHAITALLANHGEFGVSPKWNARRFRACKPTELSYDEYWDIETMRTYNPTAPDAWVEQVLTVCQRISMDVTIR
jgi:hypothetical protein